MLTRERLEEIGELIDRWNEKEHKEEEYPTDPDVVVGHAEVLQDYEIFDEAKRLVDRLASETGLSLVDIREYFERWESEFGDELAHQK